MIGNEVTEYHANHLFSILCNQLDASTEDESATGLISNSETFQQWPKTAVTRDVKGPIKDRQATFAMCQAMRRTLKSGSCARNISQLIVEDDTGVKPFSTQAKSHVDQALDNSQVTTNLGKTIAELPDRVNHVARASKKSPDVHEEASRLRHSCSLSRSRNRSVMDLTVCTPTESSTLTLPVFRTNGLPSLAERS